MLVEILLGIFIMTKYVIGYAQINKGAHNGISIFIALPWIDTQYFPTFRMKSRYALIPSQKR